MKIALLSGCIALSACAASGGLTPAAQQTVDKVLASQPGALFCALETAGGGTIIASAINATATAAVPGAAPVFVLATGLAQAAVAQDCVAAAKATGATSGIPVSPPASGTVVAPVAIVPPTS